MLNLSRFIRQSQNILSTSISSVVRLASRWMSKDNNSEMASIVNNVDDPQWKVDVECFDGMTPDKLIKEEESIMNETENDELPKENITQQTPISKEERYQQLQKLLTYSKFYTQYLQKKIQDCQTEGHKETECKSQTTNEVDTPEKFIFKSPARRGRKRGRTQHYPTLKKRKVELKVETNDKQQQPILLTGGSMRQYQREGFQWLKVLFENGVNGILGDEMGLGKTIQCIALLAHLIEKRVTGPFLVCAPVSTLPNWFAEFKKFTPKIPVLLYHGTKDQRAAMRSNITKIKNIGDYLTYPVVLTSYEIVIKDHVALGRYQWKYLVVDEGHRIKNSQCQLIRYLRRLPSLNRLLLTGTPLQNNLAELWSLLNFILPEVFDDLRIFESWFDVSELCKEGGDEHIVEMERENHILSTLHEILSPFLLRRVKTDVEIMLPPKKELLVVAPSTTQQQMYYQDILDHTIQLKVLTKQVEEEEGVLSKRGAKKMSGKSPELVNEQRCSEVNIKMMNILMQLRKCCNHPYLLEYPIDPASGEYKIDEDIINSSGKLMVMDALIQKLKEKGHKILIFSQMVIMLDILHDYCYLKNYKFSRLDGTMSLEERQEAISEFTNNPEVFLFLLSTRAGGLGLNLTAADTVIIYDSDWLSEFQNPQCDLQAMDRCHRIGQTKPVVVYRLVTAGTVDQKIIERASIKRKLEKVVIHKDCFKNVDDYTFRLSPAELLQLLKSKDHERVIHFNKQEVFTSEEWEVLLDRNFSTSQYTNDSISGRIKILEK